MRLALMIVAASLCLLMPTALASPPGWLKTDECGYSTSRVVVLEIWMRNCVGVVVYQPPCFANGTRVDQEIPETDHTAHVYVLYGWGCQTGVLVEPFP